MIENKIICWDLHHTLGHFLTIGRDLMYGTYTEGNPESLGLRKGIDRLLESLCNQGCRNFITTTGNSLQAHTILQRTGIAAYFEDIFDRETIDIGAAKLYRPVAQKVGLSDEQAQRDMLAIGDMETDQPADIGIVFVHQPGGYRYHGQVLDTVLGAVINSGEDNFWRGFEQILSHSTETKEGHINIMPDGTLLTVGYNTFQGLRFNQVTPRIQITKAPAFLITT
jgi:hypothetical protein